MRFLPEMKKMKYLMIMIYNAVRNKDLLYIRVNQIIYYQCYGLVFLR